jgi:hypothetical protein
MVQGDLTSYNGSKSRALIRYSKKEGIGYRSPLGYVDEGSAFLLSTKGCLVVMGIDGLPALINFVFGAVIVVEKFTFCIGSNSLKV